MATSNGYEKSAGLDSLVFAYDTADTDNCYLGEPTTNLFNDPLLLTDDSPDPSGPWTSYGATYSLSTETYNGGEGFSQRLQGSAGGVTFRNTGIRFSVNITTGVTYTFSVYGKNLDTITSVSWFDDGWDTNIVTKTPLSDGWSYYSVELLSNSDTSPILYIRPEGNNIAYGFDSLLYKPQFEQKDHPTQFVNGTRSDTNGLIDLMGISTVSLSTTTFGSDAQILHDGITSEVGIEYTDTNLNGDPIFTVEAVIKRTGTLNGAGFWGLGGNATEGGICSYTNTANRISIDLWGRSTYLTPESYPLNEYVHVVWRKNAATFTTSTIQIFVNGVKYTSGDYTINRNNSSTVNLNTSTEGIAVGSIHKGNVNYHGTGEVPVFKVYNDALSDSDVLLNFNKYKYRFNL